MSGHAVRGNLLERTKDNEKKARKHGVVYGYDPDERPDRVVPAADAVKFLIREKKTDLWFHAVIEIEPLVQGACLGDIEAYECQMRPWEKNEADEWVLVDHYKKLKDYYYLDEDETDADELRIRFNFPYIERPKHWRWQWRARAIVKQSRNLGLWGPSDVEGMKGWSNLTGLPWYNATPLPPPPGNIYLNVRKNTQDRTEPRWECTAIADEVGPWDIPPVDPGKEKKQSEDDVKYYEFILRFCNADGSFKTYIDDQGHVRYKQRRKTVEAKDQDDNDFVNCLFPNLRRKDKYKVKGRSIDRFNREGEFGPFTAMASGMLVDDFVPRVKNPFTGADGDFVADWDQHLLHLHYDYPTDPDDTDSDLKDPDPDIVGVQIQVSDRADFNKALSNIWFEERNHAGMHWKRRIKKPSGTLHIRIRCRNSSGTKGLWVTKSVVTKIPPVPDTLVAVTVGKMKKNKNNKWWAQGEFSYNEAGYNEDHIKTWTLLMQTNSAQGGWSAANGWGNDPEDRKNFKAKDKRSNGKFRHKFKKQVAKEWVSMAFFVDDKQGRDSPIGDWSAPVQMKTNTGPQKPTNVERIAKPRKVGIKGKRPMDPDDSTISDTNIVEYRVQRSTNSTFTNIIDDLRVDVPKMTWDLEKTDKAQYWSRIASVDEEGNQSNYVHDDGTESPPPTGASAPDFNLTDPDIVGILPQAQLPTIPYANFGTLGMSRYGTTSQMNAATAKNGDTWINSDYTPKRIYRYENGVWDHQIGVDAIFGNIQADSLVAAALDGYDIYGAYIRATERFETGNTNEPVIMLKNSNAEHLYWAGAETFPGSRPIYMDIYKSGSDFKIDGLSGGVSRILFGGNSDVEVVNVLKINNPLRYNDASLTSSTPGVSAGSAEKLPGSGTPGIQPFQWAKITNPSGTTRWFPVW